VQNIAYKRTLCEISDKKMARIIFCLTVGFALLVMSIYDFKNKKSDRLVTSFKPFKYPFMKNVTYTAQDTPGKFWIWWIYIFIFSLLFLGAGFWGIVEEFFI
jgi:hypothetical protein